MKPDGDESALYVPNVIPIFPLAGVVLLPGEIMPLHIFEPRYRAMVKDALEGPKLIGMVEVDQRGNPSSVGTPPVEPVGCLGMIGRHQELDDGRFLIWLFGIERFTIEDELPADTPYRQAVVCYTNFAEDPSAFARLRPMVEDIRRALPGLVDMVSEDRERIAEEISTVDGPQLLALSCRILEMGSVRKREVLEAASLAESFLMVYQDVNDALAGLEATSMDDMLN